MTTEVFQQEVMRLCGWSTIQDIPLRVVVTPNLQLAPVKSTLALTGKKIRRSPMDAALLMKSIHDLTSQGYGPSAISHKLNLHYSTVQWYLDPRCKAGTTV